MGLVGPGSCPHGRLYRGGRRVLCFADWSKEYGVPAWFTRNGYVKDVNFCRLYCEKRQDMMKVELEAKEKALCGNRGQTKGNMMRIHQRTKWSISLICRSVKGKV